MTRARRAWPRHQQLGHEAVMAEVMDIRLYQDSSVPMMMAVVTMTLTPLSLAFSVPVIEEPPGEAAVVHQGRRLGGRAVELWRGRVAGRGLVVVLQKVPSEGS